MIELMKMNQPRDSATSHDSKTSTLSGSTALPCPKDRLGGHGERRVVSDAPAPGAQSTTRYGVESTTSPGKTCHVSFDRRGWPALAELMAKVPEFAAFPRFRELNTKNLLYYQVELGLLYKAIEKEEEEATLNLERYDFLIEDGDSTYHGLMRKLRCLLREYNDALLQYSQVSALSGPEEYNMRSLRNWLHRADDEEDEVLDEQGISKTWGTIDDADYTSGWRTVLSALLLAKPPPKGTPDLVVTHPKSKIDGLSKWIVYYLVPFYWTLRDQWRERRAREQQDEEARGERKPKGNKDREKGHRSEAHFTMESMSEGAALRFTSSLSTIVACLIPVVAIAVLKQLSSTRDLLICITGFAVLFATGLIFLTQGTSSRTEIFAATAAFSAVMVVFISQPVINVPPGSDVSM